MVDLAWLVKVKVKLWRMMLTVEVVYQFHIYIKVDLSECRARDLRKVGEYTELLFGPYSEDYACEMSIFDRGRIGEEGVEYAHHMEVSHRVDVQRLDNGECEGRWIEHGRVGLRKLLQVHYGEFSDAREQAYKGEHVFQIAGLCDAIRDEQLFKCEASMFAL